MNGWTVVPLGATLGSYAAQWDALNQDRFGSHPLLTSQFVECLLRQFGTGREYLCILSEGASVRAMLIVRRRNRHIWTSFLPPQCQLGPTMVPEAMMLETLVTSLPGRVVQLDLLCNDPRLNAVQETVSDSARYMLHALTISISLAGSFADYWAARPRSLISNLGRYQRRVVQDGLAMRLERVTAPDQIGAALERYTQLEGAGWKGRGGTALGSTREQYNFYHEVLTTAAKGGKAVIYELWLGDQLAASRLALCGAGMLVMLKTSYDEELARYAPGRLLLHAVIEDSFSTHPGGTLEFYTDANPDQLEWAGTSRWIEHTSLFRNRACDIASLIIKAWQGPRRIQARRRGGDRPRDVMADVQVEVYATPDALPVDVRALLAEAETRNICFGFDWYRNLASTVYPEHEGLRLYVLRHGGKPIAILPLRLERGRFGWKAHSLSNYYTTLYEPILVANFRASSLLPLLGRLRADFPTLGSLVLSPMALGSHAYRVLLEGMVLGGWLSFQFFAFGNWYQAVTGTWAEYLANRNGNVRSTIKRMGKKFAADGGILELVTRSEDMVRGIAAYERVYAASWKTPEPFADFMPGLLRSFAEKGMLRLGLAWLNGIPIAAQAWIVGHGRAEIYKLAYDEAFKEFSPGTLLTAMLIQHVIEVDNVTEIDYLIGDDPYKKTWMDARRERWGIVAYNPRTLTGLLGFAREVLGRVVKHARRYLRRPLFALSSIGTAVKPPGSTV